MDANSPAPQESLQAAAQSLGYSISKSGVGVWTVKIARTDFVVAQFSSDDALGKWLALGGAQFGETK